MHIKPEIIRKIEKLLKREGFDLNVTHVLVYSKDDMVEFKRK